MLRFAHKEYDLLFKRNFALKEYFLRQNLKWYWGSKEAKSLVSSKRISFVA